MSERSTLIGRRALRRELLELLDADRPVLLVGEPGIGKTTLARAVAGETGRTVFEGGALPSRSWSSAFPVRRALGVDRLEGDAAAVAHRVEIAIGDGVLIVDDLQWADAVTFEVLGLLAERIAIIGMVRSADRDRAEVNGLIEARFTTIEVGPLDEGESLELAKRSRQGLGVDQARRLVARVGGNPLLIEELAGFGESPSLDSLLRLRLEPLSAAGRRTLLLLALAGEPLPRRSLDAPSLAELGRHGLIADDDTGPAVRHAMIGEAAIQDADPDTITACHGWLAEHAQNDAMAARHLAGAGQTDLAIDRAVAAARAARTPGEQAVHLRFAASIAGPGEAWPLVVEAAAAGLHAGDRGWIIAEADRRGDAPPDFASRWARLVSMAFRREGRLRDARRWLDAARAAGHDDEDLAWIDVEDVRLRLNERRPLEAIQMFVDEVVSRVGSDHAARAAALAAQSTVHFRGSDAHWVPELREALAVAAATGEFETELEGHASLLFGNLLEGRPMVALDAARTMAARAAALGLRGYEDDALGWEVGCLWHGGQVAEAVALAERIEADGYVGDQFYHAQALAELGRLDEASFRASRLRDRAVGGSEFDLGEVIWLEADIAWLSGRAVDAVELAEAHGASFARAAHRPFVQVVGAWAAFELGKPIVDEFMDVAADRPALLEGAGPELKGLRALEAGHLAEAASAFADAVAAWAGRHARGAIRARLAHADCLRSVGRRDESRAKLLELEADLEASGLDPWLARTRRLLRLLGERRAASPVRVADSTLTAREREIVDLVASGLREREIAARLGISRWAVTRALASASAKLGVSGQAALVAASVGA